MNRHFNTHLEGLDLQFWHDLIESRGKLVSLKKGEHLCRRGEPTNICGYVKSGYFIYTVDGVNKIGGFAFPEALLGDYPQCMNNTPAMFDKRYRLWPWQWTRWRWLGTWWRFRQWFSHDQLSGPLEWEILYLSKWRFISFGFCHADFIRKIIPITS